MDTDGQAVALAEEWSLVLSHRSRQRQRQRHETKRLLGIPLSWEDELPPKSEDEPEQEAQDDGFFGGSPLRPYCPETREEDLESGG